MALKADRYELQTDISFFMNTAGNRGGVVSMSTGGTGAAMDQSGALAAYATDPSGKMPLGILLNDVVDIDLTRQHLNEHKDEVIKGGKITILRKGYVVTNMIKTGVTPTAGDPVHVAANGELDKEDGIGGCEPIGNFLSAKDADGYCKVEINLPRA